ncbi:MAG: CotH kinase family protein [Prevotella sp.]|nr:CotH kinase family protein [Prevotella sp.]
MRRLFVAFIFLMLLAQVSHAQITVDGRPAFYDSNTARYLMSVPEDFDSTGMPGGMPVDFTHIPIIRLTGDFGNDYSAGTITLAQPSGELETYSMKAKYRGGTTNGTNRHKHNFHIKLLDASGDNLDKSLLGLRKDNSYLLDAGQVDLGRIRNHVAHEVWRDIGSNVYYAADEPAAKNYINAEFAEVFINDSYFGLYSLTEAIDRKQLKLEKFDEDTNEIHGVLYKAVGYTYTMMFGPVDPPDNTSGTWGSFELKYPEIDDVCPTDWQPFYEAVRLVAESGNDEFRNNAGLYFDMPVLVDSYVFHTVLEASDHAGKNLYWACYDIQDGQPMFTLVPWDYDTTLGQTWDNANVHSSAYGPEMGDYTTFAENMGFNLFHRLVTLDVDDFVDKTIERYWQLRETVFDEDNLAARYNDYFDMLRASGTLAREEERWSGDTDISGLTLDFDDEQAYIDDYIRRRLAYLDNIFTPEAAREAIAASVENVFAAGCSDTSEARYNVNGQRVGEAYKGIVIVGGKKLIVK